MAAKNRITVNLADIEYGGLSVIAEKYRVSLAWLGRQAIIDFLEKHEQQELQLPLQLMNKSEEDRNHG